MQKHPLLLQIRTRVWLAKLKDDLGREPTLYDVTDVMIEQIAERGFTWVWLLSVWDTGPLSREVSRTNPAWREDFERTLPDLQEDDICGSGFAIREYRVAQVFGGNDALLHFRERLSTRGIKLMLDFVPNHTGLDHPWVQTNPEYYVMGTEDDIATRPQNYRRLDTAQGSHIFAHGRDPHFDGWPDTLQLNYGNRDLQHAQQSELMNIATLCDGVRCDMAMLLLPQIFEKTWHIGIEPFWTDALHRVRTSHPDFVFLAEVYWGHERDMLELGFDYCYDKLWYDHVRSHDPYALRTHLRATVPIQNRLVRFLENHDEQRIATTLDFCAHKAASVLTYLTPGVRFFLDGQESGDPTRLSPHLCRAPRYEEDVRTRDHYRQLFGILQQPAFQEGVWHMLESEAMAQGDNSHERCVLYEWEYQDERIVIVVNFSAEEAKCCVTLPLRSAGFPELVAQDLLTPSTDVRGVVSYTVSFLLAPWECHIVRIR